MTTATDVYTLGLLLFELLTGSRYRAVHKEGEVTLRPSAALTDTTSSGAHISRAQLRGDLDAITTRALANEPQRRYGSADALADDVERHLAGRAVLARPDSFIYRTTKFLRRNRSASAAAAIAVLALVGGIIISVWQMQRAEHMAQRAERGKQFFAGLLQDADPFSASPRHSTSRDLLDNALTRIERDFADAPNVQIELRQIIQNFLARSGGAGDMTLELARRNVEAARSHYGNNAPQAGDVLVDLGIALRKSNDEDGARLVLREAERLLRHAGPAYAKNRITVMTGLMTLANQTGDLTEGRRLAEAILQQRQALDGPESPDVAMDLMNLAANAIYDERFIESVALAQRAHDMAVKLLGPDHARLLYIDQVLGMAQAYAGDTESAIVNMTRATNLARATLEPDSWRVANSVGALGVVHFLAGEVQGAIEAYSEALAHPGKLPMRATTLHRLGLAQLAIDRNEQAQQSLRESIEGMTGTSSGTRGYLQWAQAALGVAMARNGDAEAGEALARQARTDLLASSSAHTSKLGEVNLLLAEILDARGATDEARRLRNEAHTIFERILGPDHPRTRELLVDR